MKTICDTGSTYWKTENAASMSWNNYLFVQQKFTKTYKFVLFAAKALQIHVLVICYQHSTFQFYFSNTFVKITRLISILIYIRSNSIYSYICSIFTRGRGRNYHLCFLEQIWNFPHSCKTLYEGRVTVKWPSCVFMIVLPS